MKLYYSPGACSLSPHIALHEAGVIFETEKVDLGSKQTESGADYKAINPKGYVPALKLDDGRVLTEGPAIVQYIADLKPGSKLAPAHGTQDRYHLQEHGHDVAHGAMAPAAGHPRRRERVRPQPATRARPPRYPMVHACPRSGARLLVAYRALHAACSSCAPPGRNDPHLPRPLAGDAPQARIRPSPPRGGGERGSVVAQ